MATYYISNAATNGYGLGDDTAGTGTKVAPYLTLSKLMTVMGASDTGIVNPTSTAYPANVSATGRFQFSANSQVVQGDYNYTGQPIMQASTATSRVVNGVSRTGCTLQNFIIDTQGTLTDLAAVYFQASGTGMICKDLKFKNLLANQAGFVVSAAGAQSFTVEKCTVDAADSNAATSRFAIYTALGSTGSIVFKGITARGIQYVGFGSSTMSSALVQFTTAADGTRNTFDGCTYTVTWGSGTQTSIDVQYCDWVNPPTGSYVVYDNLNYGATVTAFAFKNNTYTARLNADSQPIIIFLNCIVGAADISSCTVTMRGISSFIQTQNVAITNLKIHGNTFTNVSASDNTTTLDIQAAGAGLEIYSNTISSDTAQSHLIDVGGDGQGVNIYNFGAATGQFALGSLVSNKYLYSSITQIIQASPLNYGTLTGVRVYLRKVGTPVGNVTAKLYSSSAGAPNTLLATSPFTLTAALLATNGYVEFPFDGVEVAASYNTGYFVVFTNTGAADAVNYYQIDYNANVGVVGAFSQRVNGMGSSTDGSTWVADNAKAAVIAVMSLNRECVNPLIYGNTLNSTNLAAVNTHSIIANGTTGCKVYRNFIKGGGIGVIFKLVEGTTTSAVAYDNLVLFTAGAAQALRDKGSRYARFYNNSVIISGVNIVAIDANSDYVSSGNQFPCVGGRPSDHVTFQNNIVYRNSPVTTNPIYFLGNANGLTGTGTVNLPTINYNVVFDVGATNISRDDRTGSTVNRTFAAWQGVGFDVNSLNSDPLLVGEAAPSTAADFVPSSTSPALTVGTNSNGYAPTDYLSVPYALIPNAGAYNITAFYIAAGAVKLVFNPFTSDFDYTGLSPSITNQSYPAATTTGTVTTSATVPTSTGRQVVFADATAAAVVVTLPSAASYVGTIVVVKTDAGGNAVTATPVSAQTINGSATKATSTQYGTFELASNGSNWYVV